MIRAKVTRSKTLKSTAMARIAPRIQAGLMAMGEVLLEASRKLVPRDTEALYMDGHVRIEGSGFGSIAVVGYGTIGREIPGLWSLHEERLVTRIPAQYAEWVHEGINPQTGGVYHFVTGQMDYLRQPANDPTVRAEMIVVFKAAVGI